MAFYLNLPLLRKSYQQQTQAKDLADGAERYGLLCFCYIHQNPLRAQLIAELARWPWSSYPDYAGLRAGTLCDQTTARTLLDLPDTAEELRDLTLMTRPQEKIDRFLYDRVVRR